MTSIRALSRLHEWVDTWARVGRQNGSVLWQYLSAHLVMRISQDTSEFNPLEYD